MIPLPQFFLLFSFDIARTENNYSRAMSAIRSKIHWNQERRVAKLKQKTHEIVDDPSLKWSTVSPLPPKPKPKPNKLSLKLVSLYIRCQ